jgi:hypothetical protein
VSSEAVDRSQTQKSDEEEEIIRIQKSGFHLWGVIIIRICEVLTFTARLKAW